MKPSAVFKFITIFFGIFVNFALKAQNAPTPYTVLPQPIEVTSFPYIEDGFDSDAVATGAPTGMIGQCSSISCCSGVWYKITIDTRGSLVSGLESVEPPLLSGLLWYKAESENITRTDQLTYIEGIPNNFCGFGRFSSPSSGYQWRLKFDPNYEVAPEDEYRRQSILSTWSPATFSGIFPEDISQYPDNGWRNDETLESGKHYLEPGTYWVYVWNSNQETGQMGDPDRLIIDFVELCPEGFSCNNVSETICSSESYTTPAGQVITETSSVQETIGSIITTYNITVDESITCCPDGYTCTEVNVTECVNSTYTTPMGNTVSDSGSVLDEDTDAETRTVYTVTFDRAEPTVDVFQNATIAESGSVTYQANTNATGVLSFDTPQDYYVDLNALQDDLNGTNRSVFMWVKSKGNVTDFEVLFSTNREGTGAPITTLYIHPTNDQLRVNAQNAIFQNSNFNLSGDVWNYVGYTYDATTFLTSIYVNGILTTTFTRDQSTSATSRYSLGQEFSGTTERFHYNGDMAEISVWDEVLTGADIGQAMQQKIDNTHPKHANLKGYYSVFGDCNDDNTVLKDHSGNNNDGVMKNSFTQDFQSVQSIPGFNAAGWYDNFSWKKDGTEVSTASTFTTDVAAGNYEFTATRNFVQSSDTWNMVLNQNAANVDNLADETLCADDPITRTVTANTVNYLDFERSESNSIAVNSLSEDLKNTDYSVFLWVKKESSVASGDFYQLLAFQDSDTETTSRFYITGSERVTLWDGSNFFQSPVALSNDTWYFVGFTFNTTSKEIKLYINDQEALTSTNLDLTITDNWFATLGARYAENGLTNYLDGQMAEITIWDKVLTSEEVTTLRTTAPAHNTANLMAAYGTSPGIADNQLRDLTSNGHNGLASHSTIFVNDQEETFTDYDASANYTFSWKKGEAEFDTDATGNITVEEGTTAYSVSYGTPLFQKTDAFSLSYTNLIPTQPTPQTSAVGSYTTFSVDEIDGASYQWYKKEESWGTITSEQDGFGDSWVLSVYADGSTIYAGTVAGLSISKDGGTTWTTTTSGQNGFANSDLVNSVYAEGNNVYAGTDSGLSISTNGGASWTTTTANQNGFAATSKVHGVYAEGGNVYAGTFGGGLSISTDGGVSWTTTTVHQNGFGNSGNVRSVYAEGDNVYAAVDGGGILISTNGGASWTATTANQNGFAASNNVFSVYVDGDNVYVGTVNGGLSISTDGGASWTTTTSGQNGFANSNIVLSVHVEGNTIYAGSQSGGISISTDGGANWTTTTANQNGFADSNDVNSVYADGDRAYVATEEGLSILSQTSILSNNSDNTATNQIQGATSYELRINNLTLDENNAEYFVEVTKDGCTQESDIAQLTVIEAPIVVSTIPTNNATDIAVDANIEITFSEAITKGAGNIIIKNAAGDAVETISASNATVDGAKLTINPTANLDFAVTYTVALEAGVVNGNTTSNNNLAIENALTFSTVCPDLIPTQPTNQSGAIGSSATFAVDAVDGASYQWFKYAETSVKRVHSEGINDFPSNNVYAVYESNGTVYAGTQGGLAILEAGASTWEVHNIARNNGFPSNNVQSVYESNGTIYAGTSGGGLAILKAGASTWDMHNTARNNGFPGNQVSSVYESNGTVYAATSSGGLAILEAGASTWDVHNIARNNGFPLNTVDAVYESNGTVYAGTSSGGLAILKQGASTWDVHNIARNNGFPHDIVRSVYVTNGNVYAGTRGGLAILKEGTSTWEVHNTARNNGFPIDFVQSVYESNENVYVGTNVAGLAILRAGTSTWEVHNSDNGLPNNWVTSIIEFNENVYAATAGGGLALLEGSTSLTNTLDPSAINQITGATANQLIINNLTEAFDQTQYFVVVTKGDCEETSEVVTLSVLEAPSVVSTIPANDATDIAIDANIEITFSEAISKGTGNIIIKNAVDDSVVGTISVSNATVDGAKLTIDPTVDLDFAVTYTVELEAGVVNGNTTAQDNVAVANAVTFKTVCPDLIPTQPTNQSGATGGSATFSVDEIEGASYQWFESVEPTWTIHNAAQNKNFPSGYIYSAYESEGTLYVATEEGGLAILEDGEDEWEVINANNGLPNNDIRSVYVSKGTVYVGTATGLAVLEENSNWKVYAPISGLETPNHFDLVNSVYESNGTIYAGTNRGLAILKQGQDTWDLHNTTTGNNFPHLTVYSVYESDGTVYAGTKSGLAVLEAGQNAWKVFNATSDIPLPNNVVKSVYVSNETLYAATNQGLAILKPGDSQWDVHIPERNNNFPNNRVTSVYVSDGIVYAGTSGGGVAILEQGESQWMAYNQSEGLGDPVVTSVYESNGTLYVATSLSLSILEISSPLSDNPDPNANNQITGATTNQLKINNLTQDADGTQYFVKVTKGDCEETSGLATLSVLEELPTSNPFVFTINISGADETFEIPITDSFTYDYFIDWGDGFLQSGQTIGISHAYSEAGSYDIKIYGVFPAISFDGNATNAEKVTDIKAWGDISWESMNGAFADTRLTSLSATDAPDLSKVTDLHRVFASTDLFNSDLSSWNVSTVTDMSEAFRNAKVFNGDVSNWNVANVTTLSGMFKDAKQINQDLSSWDVSAVQNMNELFANASAFNGNVSTWNVSNVTDMTAVFDDCKVFNQDISAWDVSNVTTMEDLFNSAEIFNQDISNWDVSKVTNMESVFQGARAFNIDISSWQVGNVTDMDRMFSGARMFNQDIDSWDVSKVTSMQFMLSNAFAFNQDLNSWNVANVTNMSQMFSSASVFDGNISSWDVSAVTTMSKMFNGASTFNQDISGWNVSASLSFNEMFKDATKFDQNLGAWNIKPALEDESEALAYMFDGTALSTSNYDKTLIGWAAIDGLPEGYLYDVPATFCASETQRDFLLNTLSWEIYDEGKASNCFAAPDAVTLDSFVPANGATDVAVTSNIALTFSENVQAYVYGETGTAVNDVVLYNGAGTEVERFPANSLTYSAATVTINPAADLGYSETYYLLIEAESFIANTDAKFAGVTDVNAIRFTTEAQPNTAPVASAQDITGSLEVNQQLTGSYTYTDADTDAESGTTFQWYIADDAAGANSTAISGATAQNYTLTASEEGKYIALAITPNDGMDAGTEVFTAYKEVVPAVIPTLVSTVPADEAKDIVVSNNLSFVMSESVTKGNGNIILTPTAGAPIVINISASAVTVSGTNVTIDPTTDLLEGKFYTVTFDATALVDADGNHSAGLSSQTVWNFTTKEAQVAPVASAVSINRSTVVNAPLEGSYSYSDGNDDPESGSTYQWYRADDATGTNKTAISGATSEDYVAQATEHNKYVSFEVTPNDGNQAGTAVESDFFGPVLVDDGVTNIPPAFTSDPITTILDNVTYSYTITTEDLNSHTVSLTKTTGPAWLTLSAGVLSGNPAGQVGDHIIVLTADDANGGTKTQEFTITVEASNTAPSVNGIEVTGTTTIDEQLTGSYNFIDAENDADNSSYKWYRADDNAGTNKTAIAGATATTYTLTAADAGKFISFEVTPNDSKVDGTLAESSVVGAVDKKVPTLSLADISKVYGDADFDLAATTNSSGAITYSFDNDQTSASISGATVTLGNVGTIAVDVILAEDAEYQSRAIHSSITIDKRAIEVTATDASKGVGATDPTLAFTVTNGAIVGSDNVVSVSRDAGESVGTYSMTFTDGADAGNYEISKVNGTFTINANALTITANAVNKTYGDNDPQFTYAITSGALNTGDELMGGISRVEGEDVGDYALENALYNADYQITFVQANLTIGKKDLTATADDKTKYRGDANPELTISYEGFANGDIASDIAEPTIATVADATSAIGTYDITLTGGAASNYNLNLVNGTLTVAQRPFITTWEVQASDFNGGDRVFFNASEDFTYNYSVDWGDGSVETGLTSDASHSYAADGTYTVKITGDFPHFSTDYFRFESLEQWGDIVWESMEASFFRDEFGINATDAPNLSSGPSFERMFADANIGNPNLNGWDVSTITNMSDMFSGSDFNGDISDWDVSAVTDMRSIFSGARSFNNDLSNWNTSNVVNMRGMFASASAFNSPIGDWDVSKVTTMQSMFGGAKVFNQDLSKWETGNVTNMFGMFGNTDAFNQPLDAWNVSKVENMGQMFDNAMAFNQGLNSWDVSNVINFKEMFNDAHVFNGDISNWDVSKADDFEAMFEDARAFNQNIGAWNLASAEELAAMFRDALVFNQDIGAWRFPNATDTERMFWDADAFNQDISAWEMGNITDISSMFENADSFNQDISGWDVSNITDFSWAFGRAASFNQDISSWDVSSGRNFSSMFREVAIFDQDLSRWQIASATNMGSMLSGTGLSIANYDAILISWAAQEVQNDVSFGVEGLQYCAGNDARQSLIDDHNWTIENDSQSCTATVTIADASGNEDNGNITVTLTSDAFVVGGFTVDVSTADGTAVAGTDYTAVTAQTITFAGTVGETQTFTITPTADTNVEVNETLMVSMSNLVTGANNTVTITDQATVTIENDDEPVVSFATVSASNSESVTSSAIEVVLDQAGLSTATVDYTITGTATSGTDYTLTGGTLTFAAGDVAENISLAIIDDALIEADETVVVTLSNPSGAGLGTNTVFTYTIENNDAQVTIEDVSQSEDGGNFTVTATLEGSIAGGFAVEVNTTDGTATTADGDYTALSGHTLTFAGTDGETQTFAVSSTADTKLEADETLTVSMSNLSGTTAAVVITDEATLTITNDDAAAITIADISGNEGDGAITVTATLDNAVQGGFTVDVSTTDGTATVANNDYTAVTGHTLTFAGTAGETQTFTVTPTDDLIIENDESLTVRLSNLSTSLGVDITDGATVTIVNDDFNNAPTDIALSANSIAENNALDATIGNLSTTDADAGDSHTYSLVSGAGDADNASFIIAGNELKVNNTSFNFEDRTSYSIRVQTDDGSGGIYAKTLTIEVTNVNESPFALSLTNSTIDESDDAQEVGNLMTLDPDNGDTFSYALIAGEGDTHNGQFAISGNTLSTAGAIDFEDGASRSIRVQVTDAGGLTFVQTFTITIEDVVAEPIRDYVTNVPGGNVKNVFSPNGDGVNETWVIEDLTDNPFNEVKVFAQGGKLIYSKVNYTNDWGGTFKDNPVPDGTYYYEIVIFANAQSTTPARTIKGFLTIIRNR